MVGVFCGGKRVSKVDGQVANKPRRTQCWSHILVKGGDRVRDKGKRRWVTNRKP